MAVQSTVEAYAQGAAQTAGQPDLIGSIHFLFCAGFSLAHALSFFILLLSWFLFIHPSSSRLCFTRGVGPSATRATSLKFCCSFCGATEVTSLKFCSSFFMERLR